MLRFEVNYAKSQHRRISEALYYWIIIQFQAPLSAWKFNPSEMPMLPHASSHKGFDLIGFKYKLSANSQSFSDG